MTVCWRGDVLWVSFLPVESMGRLVGLAPLLEEERQVLCALLNGVRVCLPREGLEYRQYRKSAPAGIYRRCVVLERRLREMGVIVIRNSGRQSVGD